MARLFRLINQAGAEDVGPFGDPPFYEVLITFQPLFQAGKLRPVGGEADAKYTNFRLRTSHRRNDWLAEKFKQRNCQILQAISAPSSGRPATSRSREGTY